MRGLQNVENLNATIPNLSVMGSAGGTGTSATSFRVRGIPGVGTYVDGIWQVSTAGMLTEEFVDLDRLEVLRGPQGTLFGRESIGGAVRIFTKRPADEFGGTFKGTVGSYDRHDATISANLPFSENVKTKFTFADANRDGYITSRTTGAKGGGIDQSTMQRRYRLDTDRKSRHSSSSRQLESRSSSRASRTPSGWVRAGIRPPRGCCTTTRACPIARSRKCPACPAARSGSGRTARKSRSRTRIERDQASLDVKLALTDKISVNFLTGYTDVTTKIFVDYDNSQWGLVEDTSNRRSQPVQRGDSDLRRRRPGAVGGRRLLLGHVPRVPAASVTRWRSSTSAPSESPRARQSNCAPEQRQR